MNRGDIEGADRFARRAARLRGTERQQGEVLLGQVALRREDYPTAEARFRAALALRPRLPVALAGLYDTFQRQGRFAEAEALQQETGFSPPAGIAAGRAYAMREQAFREENPTRRLALLREALAVDPSNPWLRFDLARLLLAAGQRNEARQIERDLAQDTSAEASAAAALLAAEDDRPGEVMGLLDRVPVRLRTPDMNRLLARSRQEVSVLALERQLRDGSPEARRQLIALAGGRDPSGATAAAVVRAFGRLGDTPAAVAAARAGLAANPPGGAGLRLFVAGSLAQAGQQDEADAMVAPLLNDSRLTAEERRQVVAVQASAAAVRSDRLNEAGNRVEAFRGLQPALQRQPESPLLNAALIRLYLANNQAGDAQATAEQLLARDERNRDARDVLIQIAISRRDFRRAEQLMADGKSLHPDDTRLLLLEARLAQARGDAPRAQRLLETGVRRRIAELQATGGSGQAMLTADLISPQRAAGRAGQEPTDTLSAELVRELVQAREATATWLQGGVGTRYHSGTRGLGRLNEITAPLEASTPVPGIGGRLYAQTGTVSLSNGALVGGSDAASQFGTGPLARGAAPGQRGGWITGVTVGVGYANQHVRIDAGSTPLGFQQRNVVGGVEVALPLATNLRLRVVGERRAVNESMLSYAGQRDLVTGRSWGGVTRTGVRAQLEYGVNERLGFYGGGGWATLQGENVRNNTMVELGGGLYYTALNTPTQQLTVGPDLRYFHYDRNLGGFSFGQGGYFSPQSQVIATMNADYRRQWGNLFARVQGSVGYQRFTQHAAAVFPNDSALQTQLEATPFVTAVTPRQTDSGVTGGIRANLEYALSPNLRIGAAGRFNHTGNYSEAGGLLYLRVRLDQPAQDLAPLYANAPIRHPASSFPIASTLSNGAPEPVQLNQGSSRPIW